jgi:uncharacterized membrane protein YfcA
VHWLEFGFAIATSALGALGGLGGAIVLVPLLVVTGTPARTAAPLGLVSVASTSLAGASRQLEDRLVNHRIGVTTEVVASAATVVAALGSGLASDHVLKLILAVAALAAGVFSGARKGIRNLPAPGLTEDDVGEHVGAMSGVYQLGERYVPYRAHRIRAGLGLFAVSGALAGLAGAGGGFIKTPATSELMKVPVRVAAATSTFTTGISAAVGLVVFAIQGRLELDLAAAICAGSLIGGQIGVRVQSRLRPQVVRRVLSVLLVATSVLLVARS